MIFVNVHEQHVNKGAVRFFNQSIHLQMICGGHLVNAVTQTHEIFHHIRCETTSAIAEQDAWGTWPNYDVLQQEIGDFRCGTSGKSLCFGKPSEMVYANNNLFLFISRFWKRIKKVRFNSMKWLVWRRKWMQLPSR